MLLLNLTVGSGGCNDHVYAAHALNFNACIGYFCLVGFLPISNDKSFDFFAPSQVAQPECSLWHPLFSIASTLLGLSPFEPKILSPSCPHVAFWTCLWLWHYHAQTWPCNVVSCVMCPSGPAFTFHIECYVERDMPFWLCLHIPFCSSWDLHSDSEYLPWQLVRHSMIFLPMVELA